MKIIIATLPITGRTNPALNVGSILVKAGHEVVFTSGQSFRARAESCGLKFISSPASGTEDMLDVNSRFPERNRIPVGPDWALLDFKHAFCDRSFSLVEDRVEKKVRRHLMRAQKRKGFGW